MYSSALLYQALVMLIFCVVFILIWSRGCRRNILEELQVPLLLPQETPEHRIDAATKDAENGFARCPACTFENFKRFSHCTICGQELEPDSEPGAESMDINSPRNFTARQRRARTRKQWVRVLDDEGVLKWQHQATGDEDASVGATAFTVLFKKQQSEQPQDSLETVEDALLADVSERELVLTAATDADASVFPTGFTCTSDVDRRAEIIRMAALDFPSKYAHFVVSTASQIMPAEVEFLKLSVHRDFILEESVDHLWCIQEKNIRSVMRINFLDESAVDAGGVHREWILLLNELLVESELKLFLCRNHAEMSYYLNPTSLHDVGPEHLKYYFAVGRLIGRVLLEGGTWSFHLSTPLLKIILGQPVTFQDLEFFDPEMYTSLRWILENDGVESLGLDLSVCEKTQSGDVIIVDLVEDGREIAVTDANKMAYVERKYKYTLFESVSAQLYALLKGVYEVIPQDLLILYDVEEFDYLLCGTDEIDVEDWRAHTTHSLNLNGTRVMQWFWDEVAAMSNEYRRRLFVFATGSSRVPLSGFRGLTSYDGRLCPFTLKGVTHLTEKYIVSHSCFNRLDLPLYRSREELHTVLFAILEGDVYGFTSA